MSTCLIHTWTIDLREPGCMNSYNQSQLFKSLSPKLFVQTHTYDLFNHHLLDELPPTNWYHHCLLYKLVLHIQIHSIFGKNLLVWVWTLNVNCTSCYLSIFFLQTHTYEFVQSSVTCELVHINWHHHCFLYKLVPINWYHHELLWYSQQNLQTHWWNS